MKKLNLILDIIGIILTVTQVIIVTTITVWMWLHWGHDQTCRRAVLAIVAYEALLLWIYFESRRQRKGG